MRLLPIACALLVAAATPVLALGDRPEGEEGEICVRGAWAAGGVECQAFEAEDGTLYTVLPRQPEAEPGDAACLCGKPAEMSICMQGTTLAESRAGPPEDCP